MDNAARIARARACGETGFFGAAALASVIAASLAACSPANEQAALEGCAAVDMSLTEAQRQSEARRVASALKRNPQSLNVTRVMRQGDWTLVWATPNDLEAGVFFLHRQAKPELVETWGGIAAPDEGSAIAAWARKLPGTPPAELSQCFASTIVGAGGAA